MSRRTPPLILAVALAFAPLIVGGCATSQGTATGTSGSALSEGDEPNWQDVAEKLAYFVQLDGEARARDPVDPQELQTAESLARSWLSHLLQWHGWPGKRRVGAIGSEHAFTLVQHSHDLELQKLAEQRLRKAVKQREAEPRQHALLLDRVLARQGEPQVYGSQFGTVDGVLRPCPLEDPAHVDERRDLVGLPHIAEYAEHLAAGRSFTLEPAPSCPTF